MKKGNHYPHPAVGSGKAKSLAPIRIGLTLPLDAENSTAAQSAYFMARTLEQIPGVKVFAVNNFPLAKRLKIEYTEKGPGYLKAIIEVGTKLGPVESRAFRVHKGKLIHYVDSNTMVLNMEHVSGGEGSPDLAQNDYDAVWCAPHVFEMNCDYYKLMYGCPVDKVPHIWAPDFLPEDWGYVPGQQQKIVATFEPSVSVVRTPHVSIMAADHAFRREDRLIDELRVFGHGHLICNSLAFKSFAKSMSMYDRTVYMPTQPFTKAMKDVSAVVAHQWGSGLDHHWYALVYGGFPLVHNSEMFGAGYRYAGFDAKMGGEILHQVLESHDELLVEYKEVAKKFLALFSPEKVRPSYVNLLKARFGDAMP